MTLHCTFQEHYNWSATSPDPKDVQFGKVIDSIDLDQSDNYDIVFVGEPWDGGTRVRPGSREGPDAVREALESLKTYHLSTKYIESSIGDLGNAVVPAGWGSDDVYEALERDITGPVHDSSAFPVFLGGGHELATPNVKPLLDGGESVGVINFDSHHDWRETFAEKPQGGTPYRLLHESGLDEYLIAGARNFDNSGEYIEYITEQEAKIITPDDIYDDVQAVGQQLLDFADTVEVVSVSLDLDVIDSAFVPGTQTPCPGGPTPREIFRLLQLIAGHDNIESFEVYEVAPWLGSHSQTPAIAARAVAHFLSGRETEPPAE